MRCVKLVPVTQIKDLGVLFVEDPSFACRVNNHIRNEGMELLEIVIRLTMNILTI